MIGRPIPRCRHQRFDNPRSTVAALVIAALAAPVLALPQQLPNGFVAVDGRAALSAIDDPRPVAAAGAPIDADAWIVGVEIEGSVRAYDLGLLNRHEVVNDRIGDIAFAVAWSPYANAAVVYDRVVDGETLALDPTAGLVYGGSVLQDRQTGTYWPVMSGRGEAGPLAGTRLRVLPVSDRMTWARWVALHPTTDVLTAHSDGAAATAPDFAALREFFASAEGYGGVTATDAGLDSKRPVYGFHRGEAAYAVDTRRVIGGRSFALNDGSHILLYREAGDGLARATAAFVSGDGFEQRGGSWYELGTEAEFNAITRDFGGARVARLNGFDTFWYTWSLGNPGTELFR